MIVRAKPDVNQMLRCEREHQGIRPGDVLIVIEYSEEYVRLLDRDADPVLYPLNEFDILDPTIPERWTKRVCDGQFRAFPPEYAGYFFEQYHDHEPATVAAFHATICRVLTESLPT
jgi:hypothetical protein